MVVPTIPNRLGLVTTVKAIGWACGGSGVDGGAGGAGGVVGAPG